MSTKGVGEGNVVFLDRTTSLLETGLKLSARQNGLIAGNLANIDTPGYQPQEMSFAAALNQAVNAGSSLPISASPGVVRRNDGNGVDLDTEMAQLTKSGLRYQFISSELRDRYNQYRLVIEGGGTP